eukprot:9457892-Pyramimonas_sp.AAC.1
MRRGSARGQSGGERGRGGGEQGEREDHGWRPRPRKDASITQIVTSARANLCAGMHSEALACISALGGPGYGPGVSPHAENKLHDFFDVANVLGIVPCTLVVKVLPRNATQPTEIPISVMPIVDLLDSIWRKGLLQFQR